MGRAIPGMKKKKKKNGNCLKNISASNNTARSTICIKEIHIPEVLLVALHNVQKGQNNTPMNLFIC